MKKLLPLIVTAFMLLLLVACDSTPSNTDNGENDVTPPNYADSSDTTLPDNQPTKYLLKTYSSTDEYENSGTYTEINDKYSVGENIELEATVKSGYNFVGWFINDTCVSENLKYTFTMKSSNVEIEARYNYFTVLTSSYTDDYTKAGTYTELNSKKISVGEQVTIEATVNDGYNFEGWFINDICVSEELTYSFVMKEKDINLEAKWNYFTVTVESDTDEQGTAGTFTKKVNEKVSIGKVVTLTATVNNGFNFEGWYVDGNLVSGDFEYSFMMPNEDVEVEAVYSFYYITVESRSDKQGMAGTYPQKQKEKVSVGETVTLTATVTDGYNFEGWYIDGVCVCSELTYQFVMEKANKTIQAEYSYYTLTTEGFLYRYNTGSYFDDGVAGTYTKYDETKISVGEVINLVATVKDGYTFEGWYIRNVCVSTELEYSYTMQKNDVEIKAKYTYYTISTDAYLLGTYGNSHFKESFEDNMGSYTQYDEEKFRVGETVTLTATVKEGYRFVGWKHGNTIVCEEMIYTFIMGAGNEEYEAVFEEL